MKKCIVLLSFLVMAMACDVENKTSTPANTDTTKKINTNKIPIQKRKLAKFEPSDGKVLLFVGQELEAIGGLKDYNNGYLDHFQRPAGWTTYTNFGPNEVSFGLVQEGFDGIYTTKNWGDGNSNASLQLASPNFENMALAIGLSFVNNEEKVADGTHDKLINQLADFLLSLGGRPVFLRIAYEFDGEAWNHYDQKSTIAAYKRIVDMLRARGVTNTAYVWQSTESFSTEEQLENWYPGDDYVDWLGVSFFNNWAKITMFDFARKKGKPVFIAEATPTITNPKADPNSGTTLETKLSNPEQATQAWNEWFIPFFHAIKENKDVVKAVSYINCRWDSHPMWYDNPTFKGIDARIHLSNDLSRRWMIRTSRIKYIKSSPTLYDDLYNNK